MKECKICKNVKSLEDFHNNKNFPDGKMRECKPCNNSRASAWGRNNPDKVKSPEAYLKRNAMRHGITQEEFLSLRDSQDNLCAICKISIPTSIDHNHNCCNGTYSCGSCIRGLLCGKCNRGIGHFNDDIALLSNAIDYLNKFKSIP